MRQQLAFGVRVFVFVCSFFCVSVVIRASSRSDINVTCAGVDDTSALASAVGASGQKTIVIGSGQVCTAGNLTIGNLRIEVGGLLKPLTAQTVVLTGHFEAGPYQTFSNALPGQGRISFAGNTTLTEIFTEWWGAKADGRLDCTKAISSAIASLPNNTPGANGAIIKLLAGDYRVTGISIRDQQAHIIGSGGPGSLGSTATSSTFISSVSDSPIIKYDASKEVYSFHSRLENVTILGSVTAGPNQVGVWVDNNGVLINNVGIEKTGSHGLYLTSSSTGGYSNMEINSMKGDGIRIDFSKSATPGAGTHNNIFHRISIGGTLGDAVRIMHGNGNVFFGLNIENTVGDKAGAGAGIHIYYPGDGKLEPQNNMFYGVWNENNVVGDLIGNGAQNNYVSYVHYTSPEAKITGNNSYRSAAELNKPAIDRASYLSLGDSETVVKNLLPTPAAPVANVGRGPGLKGQYTYKITFETQVGETKGGATSAIVTVGNQSIQLSRIPIGPPGTLRRNIYRTAAGGGDNTQRFVATLSDNVTTDFQDNLPDASLGRKVPLYNASASRIVLDGEGNLAQLASSAQTALVGPQISDSKWPSYGFLSRPGFGMYMENADELSFVASPSNNPVRKLRLLSTGVTDAIGGLSVGSGAAISSYLSGTAELDFAAWSGNDCQEKEINVAGAEDGDVVVIGISNSLASVPDVTWSAWVFSSNTIKVRGCKVTPGRSIDPPSAKIRASVVRH